MLKALKIVTLLFCINMTLPNGVQSAPAVTAESEFKRALSIIENTQLEIFTDTVPLSTANITARLEQISADKAAGLEATSADFNDGLNQIRLDTMRSLLSETIDAYNDQYANYISPAQLKKYNERRSGSYHGIGLKFRAITDEYPLVIGPITSGPLAASDLLPGDKIIEAGNRNLKGLGSGDIVKILKGPADSTIRLQIERGNKTHIINARRGAVDLHYTRSKIIEGNIGYIQISRFGGKTHQRVSALLNKLLDQNVQGIILDLRNNPGGSTRAARAIVSMFSNERQIYCEMHKSGKIVQLPRHGKHMTDLPLAILVNGDSMSASEIVAGALQSYGRAIVIGSPTYGKGLVQRVFNLKKPLGGAIRTTIAVFGTPDHKAIHGGGIVPDIYIETPADFMFRRTGSLNITASAREFQRTLLEQRVREKHPHKAQALIAATDKQLQVAIEQIHKPGKG